MMCTSDETYKLTYFESRFDKGEEAIQPVAPFFPNLSHYRDCPFPYDQFSAR